MEDRIKEKDEEIEIDLKRLTAALLKKAWLIGAASVLCALAVLAGTVLFVPPRYESSAMFYVNNNSLSLGDTAVSISSGDISASRGLVKSYIVILNSRESLNDVINYAQVNRTCPELKKMITAEAVDSTEIFEVVVTSPDPVEAEKIADAIAYILPKRISSIIEGTSAKIVDAAVMPTRPSSPGYVKNTLIGFVLGFALAAGTVALQVILDTTIRGKEDVEQICKYPILSGVPDMEAPGGKQELVGNGIAFTAAEAYKLLRTKLQFSFADEKASRVIGISSALCGEGKSLSAINLAHSLSQLGKKVILIDCDMRRPTLAEKLYLPQTPGLSDFLTGQSSLKETIRYCGIRDDEAAFRVIAAGGTPPNPIELLSSERMTRLLKGLREICDYVLLDLPPVGEVSDALALSRNTDGFLLVVRQDRCNRLALNNAVRQFEYVDARILGVVFNCATEAVNGYGGDHYAAYCGAPAKCGKRTGMTRALTSRKITV